MILLEEIKKAILEDKITKERLQETLNVILRSPKEEEIEIFAYLLKLVDDTLSLNSRNIINIIRFPIKKPYIPK